MRLQSGERLGPYEVLSPLGQGGMGEVYRARDTKLGRVVALKILPHEFAADPDRLARFRREAQVLASLNHPAIAQLYGLEDSTEHVVLVMELVEGPTLAELIASGPIPVDDALPMAIQICEALEAAHAADVVHRDLKPANIKVRPDGAVKVLDLGLAKVRNGREDAEAPTVAATSPGTILGTPAYMAPEQAKGMNAGSQADIWAFGCVLFEMLTGRPAFARETFAETVANVISGVPDLARLPPATPPLVRRVIRRCLEKDPRARLHHIGDARTDLTEARLAPERPATEQPVSNQRAKRGWFVLSLAAVAVVAATAGWWAERATGPNPPFPVRLSMSFVEPPRNLPFGTRHVAISNDGSRVAFAADGQVWIRRLQEKDARALGVQGVNPFFSPDGQWVAFFTAQALVKVPSDGGPPSIIVATTERPGGGAWFDNGTIVFATNSGLYRIPSSGGQPELIAAPDRGKSEKLLTSPDVLPGGRSVLFTVASGDTDTRFAVAAINLDTRTITHILDDASSPRFLGTGHLIYASGSAMKAVAFDPGTLKPSGRPFDLPDLEAATARDNGVADYAVSPSGTLIFASTFGQRRPVSLVWVDRNGTVEAIPAEPRPYAYPRVSPDGRRVALDVRGNNRDIWILDLARLTQERLTDGPTEDMLPLWSRDGRRIFFASDRQGNFDIYSQPADGATGATLEFAAPGVQAPESFMSDSGGLLVDENYEQVSLLQMSGPRRIEPLVKGAFKAILGQISPDGKWIVYESTESGSGFEIYVRPFPGTSERREKISTAGGRFPLWSPRGGELYFVELDGDVVAASISFSPALHVDRITPLFRWQAPPPDVSGRPYDVSPIDGRFLMIKPSADSATGPTQIAVVLNWLQELLRRERAARLE